MSYGEMIPGQREASERQQDVMDSLDQEFYSYREVARMLGRGDQVVADMMKSGEIPNVTIGSGGKRRRVVAEKTLAKLLAPTPVDKILRRLGI